MEGTETIPKSGGVIGKRNLHYCKITLRQLSTSILHVHTNYESGKCNFPPTCPGYSQYFGDYDGYDCLEKAHSCVQDENSTAQLWLGKWKPKSKSV